MVVGDGTLAAGPWDGGPSNSCNKQYRPGERHDFKLSLSIGICIFIMNMQNMQNNYVNQCEDNMQNMAKICIIWIPANMLSMRHNMQKICKQYAT